MIFARISLDRLEPDLVIMDEFQRFRFLLDAGADSDIGMLTRKFFHSGKVRMLLLSATPYKMYSTPEEIDEDHIDQHYEEFLMVMNFLNEKPEQPDDVNEKRKSEFLNVWKDYTVEYIRRHDESVMGENNRDKVFDRMVRDARNSYVMRMNEPAKAVYA